MSNYDPNTYKEAVTDIEWQKAIDSELESRNKLKTWKAALICFDNILSSNIPIATKYL